MTDATRSELRSLLQHVSNVLSDEPLTLDDHLAVARHLETAASIIADAEILAHVKPHHLCIVRH